MNDIENILYDCRSGKLTIEQAEEKICDIIVNECESDYRMGFEEGWDEGYEEARHEFSQ